MMGENKNFKKLGLNVRNLVNAVGNKINENSQHQSKNVLPKLESNNMLGLAGARLKSNLESNRKKKIRTDILNGEFETSNNKEDSKLNEVDQTQQSNNNDGVLITPLDLRGRRKKENEHSILSFSGIQHSKRASNKSNSRNLTKRGTQVNKPLLGPLEKIKEVETIRNKLIEEYIKLTSKNYAKQKKHLITKWKSTIELLQNLDAKLFLHSLKCLADIFIEFDEFENAKNFYFYFKFYSNYLELPDEVMLAYESLGNVYKFLYQYHKSIMCYKKQIELSWALNDKNSELRAYDNIGIQYFYLGNRDKAMYYHERMLYGRSEHFKSEMRESVSKNFKNKNFHIFADDKYVKNNKTNDELKDKLKESLAMFDDNKTVDLENVDILRNQENMKNSFVSDVDITFTIIPEKYLNDDETSSLPLLPNLKNLSSRIGKKNMFLQSNNMKHKTLTDGGMRSTSHIVDNMILSHLSTKRKEFNSDRFRKIFEKFDKMLEEVKMNYKLNLYN